MRREIQYSVSSLINPILSSLLQLHPSIFLHVSASLWSLSQASILPFILFLSPSLFPSLISLDAINEHQGIKHYRMPPLDSASAQTKRSHFGTTSCTSAAETASTSRAITEYLSESIYCKRLERGTIPVL